MTRRVLMAGLLLPLSLFLSGCGLLPNANTYRGVDEVANVLGLNENRPSCQIFRENYGTTSGVNSERPHLVVTVNSTCVDTHTIARRLEEAGFTEDADGTWRKGVDRTVAAVTIQAFKAGTRIFKSTGKTYTLDRDATRFTIVDTGL